MDKKANRFIQKCQKSLKLQQHFSHFQLTSRARPFEVIRGHWNQHNTCRSATYGFLLVIMETMGLSRTVSVIKSDDCNNLPVRVFNVSLRGFPVEFCYAVGSKTRNINYCVRGGHKPARWPWPTSPMPYTC